MPFLHSIASTYTKTSVPYLRIDAQFTVIEAALKGCLKWLTAPGNAKIVGRLLMSAVHF